METHEEYMHARGGRNDGGTPARALSDARIARDDTEQGCALVDDDTRKYMQILEANDDPKNLEFPPDFDYEAAERRFLEMAQEFERVVGVPSKIMSGSSIQDASFHGEIDLAVEHLPFRPEWAEQATLIVALRVSNFGRMASVGDEAIFGRSCWRRSKPCCISSGISTSRPACWPSPTRPTRGFVPGGSATSIICSN
jgi:hypothetical protein